MRAVICLHLFSRLYILRALLALDENTPYGRIAPRCASNCASSNPPLSLSALNTLRPPQWAANLPVQRQPSACRAKEMTAFLQTCVFFIYTLCA